MPIAKDKPWKLVALGALVLFVVLVCAQLVTHALLPLASSSGRSGLYAVFLTNGQVYFGTVTKEDEKRLVLTNIYYIQLKNGQNSTAPTDANDVSLLKLGSEFHGPEDYMEINQQNVLFLEKLKSDGKVAQAISSYQTK